MSTTTEKPTTKRGRKAKEQAAPTPITATVAVIADEQFFTDAEIAASEGEAADPQGMCPYCGTVGYLYPNPNDELVCVECAEKQADVTPGTEATTDADDFDALPEGYSEADNPSSGWAKGWANPDDDERGTEADALAGPEDFDHSAPEQEIPVAPEIEAEAEIAQVFPAIVTPTLACAKCDGDLATWDGNDLLLCAPCVAVERLDCTPATPEPEPPSFRESMNVWVRDVPPAPEAPTPEAPAQEADDDEYAVIPLHQQVTEHQAKPVSTPVTPPAPTEAAAPTDRDAQLAMLNAKTRGELMQFALYTHGLQVRDTWPKAKILGKLMEVLDPTYQPGTIVEAVSATRAASATTATTATGPKGAKRAVVIALGLACVGCGGHLGHAKEDGSLNTTWTVGVDRAATVACPCGVVNTMPKELHPLPVPVVVPAPVVAPAPAPVVVAPAITGALASALATLPGA